MTKVEILDNILAKVSLLRTFGVLSTEAISMFIEMTASAKVFIEEENDHTQADDIIENIAPKINKQIDCVRAEIAEVPGMEMLLTLIDEIMDGKSFEDAAHKAASEIAPEHVIPGMFEMIGIPNQSELN